MSDTVIYHNPRCSKSRATLALLEENGIQATIIEYLKNPPTAKELDSMLTNLGIEPRQLIRKTEKEYKEAGLDNMELSRDQIIEAMVAYPKTIERPIVIKDGKVAVGRPPENILKIL